MDLRLYDTGDGGEVVKTPTDLQIIKGLGNMVYLAMFGGNIEADTQLRQEPGSENKDYWQNRLLNQDQKSAQMNSATERAIKSNALNSDGRSKIEDAVKSDLQFMTEFSELETEVLIVGPERLDINVRLREKGAESAYLYKFIWGATLEDFNNSETSPEFKEGINYWYVGSTFVIS